MPCHMSFRMKKSQMLDEIKGWRIVFCGWVFVFYFSVQALILEECVEGVGILAAVFKDYKSWTGKD